MGFSQGSLDPNSPLSIFLANRNIAGSSSGQPGFSGIGGLGASTLLNQQQQVSSLPALPKIPKLTEAPSRANESAIAGAARRQRVLASKRKGRASTILGGSVGEAPQQRTLLGV